MEATRNKHKMSLFSYLTSEVTRGYVLDHDEERYTTRRQKMYTFMKIPRELEKFMSYGFFHCLDSFLFVFTFLPIRFILAVCALIVRAPLATLGFVRPYHGRILYPAEKIDLLKGLIIGICAYTMTHIDTSMMYHLIKSQSVIKLYLFYNMLEVGDRLFSAFGQDTIDALFWTATEPTLRKREHIGVIPHFLLTITYVILHTMLVLLQATTLNVAINASNKALLTIMMSNNFVELKGSVFKKFDKNNLFQVSCSDVRERFHLFALLFIVVVQTMKEYGWREESFWSLAPDCLLVLGAEFLVDWIKHAFITRFNEVSAEVYKDYTTYLAYDLAQTKQKHAFSDHSDIVSRRMGFIPLPLGVVMIRVITNAVRGNSRGAPIIVLLAYLCLVTFRILSSIVILGKACDLIDTHQLSKQQTSTSPKHEKVSKNEKPDKGSRNEKIEKGSKSSENSEKVLKNEEIEEVGNDFLKAADEEKSTKIVAKKDPPILLKESLPDLEDFSVGTSSVFFDNSPICTAASPPFGIIDRVESLSKSSSIILEEEEEEDLRSESSASERDVQNDEVMATPVTTSIAQHRWSNSRSTKFLVARGEFNKSVYSDSRRRPLSCTPPSTSLSTSASVEEEDDAINFVNSVVSFSSTIEEKSFTEQSSVEETEAKTVPQPPADSSPKPSTFLPDLLQLGQQQQANVTEQILSGNDRPTAAEKMDSEVKVSDCLLSTSCRSMSSPDFLLLYQAAFDPDRDWPQVELDDEADSGGGSTFNPNSDSRRNIDDQVLYKSASSTSRRSSVCVNDENRLSAMRNRKRFDTDRL